MVEIYIRTTNHANMDTCSNGLDIKSITSTTNMPTTNILRLA